MLDHALQYAGRGWPIFRLSAHKVPFKGSHGHLDATTDAGTITRWWTEKPLANIGLATGRIVVIDPDGPTALDRLTALGAGHGGWPLTLTAKTPRGIHLYYAAPEGIEIRSWNEPRAKKGDDGIDIKGQGGYVVLPPSKSRNGEYQWLVNVPLSPLPDWALNWINSLKGPKPKTLNNQFASTPLPDYLLQSKSKTQSDQVSVTKRASASLGTPWSEREEARIRSALAAIPAQGYDRWVHIGMALHALAWDRPDGTSIGFELFDDWSATEPDLYSLDTTEKKWASFGRSGRHGVTLGTLFHLAEQHGWNGLAPRAAFEQEVISNLPFSGTHNAQPHSAFPQPGGAPYVNGHASAAEVLPDGLNQPVDESPLIMLNGKYACIGDLGGKCLVLGWVPSKVDDTIHVPSFQNFKSFAERFANRYIMVTKKKGEGQEEEPAQLGAYWLKWRRRRSFDGIDLVPNQPAHLPGNMLNLWQGFAVQPAAGRWDRMKEHIAEILAESNAEQLDYIMRWSAWAVQNPGERAEVAMVFRGEKGAGKGTFAHALRRMFGQHGLHISNAKHLVGSFNAHLRNCLLLYADEAFWAGDKQGESVLKALITEPVQMIEQKGVDAQQWKNRVHLIMTANAEWVVPASHDERRYAVFNVSSKKLKDEKYFAALYKEMREGGLAAMLHDLMRVQLDDWHPRRIPNTEALREQKSRSMSLQESWWESLLQEGCIPAAPKDTPDIAMAQYLMNHARDFAPRLKDLSSAALGRFLAEHGCIKLHRANGNAWRFPELPKARTAWERRYQGWNWERPAEKWTARN